MERPAAKPSPKPKAGRRAEGGKMHKMLRAIARRSPPPRDLAASML